MERIFKWTGWGVVVALAFIVGINIAVAQGVQVPGVFARVVIPAVSGKVCLDGPACTTYLQQRTAGGYAWISVRGGNDQLYIEANNVGEPAGNWKLQGVTGILYQKKVDTSGTPGNATANLTASGQSAIASGVAAVTITSDMVDTASRVFAQLQANDTTCTSIKSVVPGAGSFVINVNANCTAATKVAWNIFK